MFQEVINIIIFAWLFILTIFIFFIRDKIKIRKFFLNKNYKSKRYIIFSVIVEDSKITRDEIEECIRYSVKELLGKVWLELSNPKVIYFREDTYEGVISTNRIG
ncbi:MAG: Rpp14/Pop5 family protein, partial [Sulfolobaceae archaeon]